MIFGPHLVGAPVTFNVRARTAAVVTIRDLCAGDSLDEITDLLHRAYAPFGLRGLNYTAVDQPVTETARRIAQGHCAVATIDCIVVGTVLTRAGPNLASRSAWYQRTDVASAQQFAVDPTHQRKGIGSLLMRWAEEWAKSKGFAELAVDTAEVAGELVAFYERRGYRFIEYGQWPGKRYRSVVLSKSLGSQCAP